MAGGPKILERETELRAGEAALDAAAGGNGVAVLIEGPAGVGKTTLLRSFDALARDRGFTTLGARASPVEGAEAWIGVRRLFDRTIHRADPGERERLLTGAAVNAAPALGLESPAGGVLDPFTCIHGLYWLVGNLANDGPLLICVDDVQWLDEPSARWLTHMASRSADLPIALVLTRRAGEPAFAAQLLDQLEDFAEVERLSLRELSEAGSTALVRTELGDEADESVLASCHSATGGNPLFLVELCRELARSDKAPGSVDVGVFGPAGVARSVAGRVQRLGPDAEVLAASLAVLGDRVDLAEVAAIAGLDLDAAGVAAEALADAAVIEPGRPLRFRHPIVEHALYESLAEGERSRRHRLAAETLHAQSARSDRVASHLLRAGPGGDNWVVERLEESAAGAAERGASDVAAAYLRRALEEPPPDTERPRIRFRLALAALGRGGPGEIADLVEAVAALPAGERSQSALDASKVLGLLTEHEAALAVCVLGIEDGEIPVTIASRLNDEMVVHMLPVGPQRWPELDPQMIYEAAPAPPDAGAEALRTVSAALVAVKQGRPIQVGELREALPRLLGEFPTLAFAACGLALIWSDELDAAHDLTATALAHSRQTGSPTGAAQWSAVGATASLRAGRVSEALAEATASADFNREQPAPTLAWPLAPLVDCLVLRGELDEASAVAAWVAERPQGFLSVALLTESLGRLALEQTDLARAADLFRETGDHFESMGYAGPPITFWRSWLARTLTLLGNLDEAREYASAELRIARAAESPRAVGQAQLALAGCMPTEERQSLMTEAVATLRACPARLELGMALVDLGAEARRRGAIADARDALREAMQLATACGAPGLEEKARAELAASGARPRRRALLGVESLTPSEHRVAAMTATGLTNREVAQALFLSEKTVEGHLRGVFRKLEIQSRTEIASRLTS